MKRILSAFLTGLVVLALVLVSCAPKPKEAPKEETAKEEQAKAVSKLQLIKERGKLIVGCNAELPGFGYLNPKGEFEGFDIDFGKAIAAAVFGDQVVGK